jgi:sporulation protein YlmC with PRC-barrel domain
MDDDQPISWRALEEGTKVVTSDAKEVGAVSTIVADEEKDIFSGIAFRSGVLGSQTFAPADLVGDITPEEVRLTISEAEVEELDDYEG